MSDAGAATTAGNAGSMTLEAGVEALFAGAAKSAAKPARASARSQADATPANGEAPVKSETDPNGQADDGQPADTTHEAEADTNGDAGADEAPAAGDPPAEGEEDAGTDDAAGGEDEGEAGEETDTDNDAPVDDKRPAWLTLPDGKREKVTVGELKAGYLRQQDYTRKTMAVAAEVKAVADLGTIRKRYLDMLSVLDDGVVVPPAPDPSLADEDLNAYIKADRAHRDALARKEGLKAERAKVAQEQSSEAQTQLALAQRRAAEVLLKAVPQWSDPAVYDRDRLAMTRTALDLGFTAEEAASWIDPRIIYTMHQLTTLRNSAQAGQARLRGAAQGNGAGNGSKPATAAAAVTAPRRTGSRPSGPTVAQQRIAAARQTHMQRGTVDSAVDLLLAQSRLR